MNTRAWILGAFLVGCSGTVGSAGDDPSATPILSEDGTANGQPRGIYKVIDHDRGSETEQLMSYITIHPLRTIFVNKSGGHYVKGNEDSRINSSSITNAAVDMPPWSKGDAAWTAFYNCIKDEYARFNVLVTDQDPGTATHIEAVVSGTPDMIGMGQGVGGVAPMMGDCSTVENGVVWVFEQALGSEPQTSCEVAAQEIGHAIGMDHERLCQDPMTYLYGCGRKTFQDQTVRCGEYADRDCMCTNPLTMTAANQNSVQFMNYRLGAAMSGTGGTGGTGGAGGTGGVGGTGGTGGTGGAGGTGGTGGGGDTTAPTVSIVSPADGATLTANAAITIVAAASDNVGVTKAVLHWDYNNVDVPCDNSISGVTCTQSGGQYTWSFQVGSGDRAFHVTAYDAAGNSQVTAARTVHLGSAPPPPPTTLTPTITTPANGTTIHGGDSVTVTATVGAANLSTVSLDWQAPSGSSSFPMAKQSDGSYSVTISVRTGAVSGQRTLTVTARDTSANSGSAHITLQVP